MPEKVARKTRMYETTRKTWADILICILRKWGERFWIGLIRLRRGTSDSSYELRTEPSSSIQDREFLHQLSDCQFLEVESTQWSQFFNWLVHYIFRQQTGRQNTLKRNGNKNFSNLICSLFLRENNIDMLLSFQNI